MSALYAVLGTLVALFALAMTGARCGVLTFQLRKPPKAPEAPRG